MESNPCSKVTGTGADKIADTLWVQVKELTKFRGTKEGCLRDGKATVGACKVSETTGVNIKAKAPMVLNRWRSDLKTGAVKYYVFCKATIVSSTF